MKKLLSLILIFAFCVFPVKHVLADDTYTIIREPVYSMADTFTSNVTKVANGSLWGICDTNGYLISGYRWEAMGEIVDELIPARQNSLWGYIDLSGKEVIPYSFTKAENFNGDLARVLTQDGKYAYIDRSGNISFFSPFEYSFSPREGFICGVSSSLYGYCDEQGNIVIHPQFDMGFDFCDGLAAVKVGEKWGYISPDGTYRISPEYDYASDFSGGFAVCAFAGKYGIIDKDGNALSPLAFDYIGICDETGRFPAKLGDKAGYINSTGDWVLSLNYDFCYNFTDGVARVFKDNLWGYIDINGQEIVSPQFADCGEYKNGRAFFSVNGLKYGFLTLDTKNYKIEPLPNIVVPQNPAQEFFPTESAQKKDPSIGTYEEIIDVNDVESIPTFPDEENMISMRIGSIYALRVDDAKKMSASPALVDGVTMVPLRDVVEYMGGSLEWDSSAQRISITYKDNVIIMTVGSTISFVNGVADSVSSAPDLINGVTMIPVRSVTKSLGCTVLWIPETQNICIKY